MAKKTNIIELNGHRYDAVTGVRVQTQRSHVAPKAIPEQSKQIKAPSMRRGSVVDGIMAPHKGPHQNRTNSAITLAPIPVHPAPPVNGLPKKAITHPLKPINPHQPEHSKTLMRHTVHKPTVKPDKPLKAQVPTDLVKHQPAVLAAKPKLSSDQVDEARAARAQQTPRNGAIERFYTPKRLTASRTSHPTLTSAASQPRAHTYTQGAVHDINTSGRVATRSSLFDQALKDARSHEETPPKESHARRANRFKRSHVKVISISAVVSAMAVLTLFIAYQNKAMLELKIASTRAGFHASMPAYKPVGFAFKNLSYSPGDVTLGFSSGDKSYTISQKQSNWDSTTLLQNYVETSDNTYQAYSAAGRTIYIYDNGNATWVNGGVWYQISNTANLSSDQIINLATSM